MGCRLNRTPSSYVAVRLADAPLYSDEFENTPTSRFRSESTAWVDRADRRNLRTHAPYKFVGSPASEQSAHHAADQATRTATPAVMLSTTPAATMGQMAVIGFVAAAGAGVRC
jgi:hypothetical protein